MDSENASSYKFVCAKYCGFKKKKKPVYPRLGIRVYFKPVIHAYVRERASVCVCVLI